MTRQNVTSDPDRGVAVNTGTDPQRPGTPTRARPEEPPSDGGTGDPAQSDAFEATRQPARPGRQDVEGGGGKNDPDDAL